jgi:hypothetical protein
MTVANALAYYNAQTMTPIKSVVAQTTCRTVDIKTFLIFGSNFLLIADTLAVESVTQYEPYYKTSYSSSYLCIIIS